MNSGNRIPIWFVFVDTGIATFDVSEHGLADIDIQSLSIWSVNWLVPLILCLRFLGLVPNHVVLLATHVEVVCAVSHVLCVSLNQVVVFGHLIVHLLVGARHHHRHIGRVVSRQFEEWWVQTYLRTSTVLIVSSGSAERWIPQYQIEYHT